VHAAEFTLVSLAVVASQIGGRPVQALAVEFAPADPGPAENYRPVFGVAPQFDAPVSCLVLAGALLDSPVPAAEMLTAQVRRQLTEGMANEPMTLTQVARRLHLAFSRPSQPSA
jgi:Arabinose-binding domain of AraC transcription regulator, N-term